MSIAAQKARNNFTTFVLVAALTALLLVIGQLVGGGGGLIVFAGLAVVMNLAMYWFSGKMALKMARAQEVSEAEAPELHRMVAELAHRAGIPKPRVYATPDEQPNAFATGRNPANAAVAVTAGITRMLPERELAGVIAHEIAHIKNRDILIASIAAMVAGVISAVANFLQFSFLFGGNDEDSSPLGFIGAIATMMLAPIAAGVMQMAISRQREYVADATGAQLLRDPLPLADALQSLHRTAAVVPMQVNPAAAPLFIVNPLAAFGGRGLTNLFATHPPMEERIARLHAMIPELQAAGGAAAV